MGLLCFYPFKVDMPVESLVYIHKNLDSIKIHKKNILIISFYFYFYFWDIPGPIPEKGR